MRGRLIFPFQAEIACFDTSATAAQNSGAGFDDVFQEPVRIDDGTQDGASSRTELVRRITVQVEPAAFDRMNKMMSGDVRESVVTLIAHFAELERLGFVLPDGNTVFQPNDRLCAIRRVDVGNPLVLAIPEKPGLYLHEALRMGYGFSTHSNLLQLRFKSRAQGK